MSRGHADQGLVTLDRWFSVAWKGRGPGAAAETQSGEFWFKPGRLEPGCWGGRGCGPGAGGGDSAGAWLFFYSVKAEERGLAFCAPQQVPPSSSVSRD